MNDAFINRRDILRLAALAGAGTLIAPSLMSAPAMQIRRIPSSNETLPVIGLGTWQTFDTGTSPAERAPLEEVLARFVALGGKLVDSSPMYGRAEGVVGDIATKLGIQRSLFLATKVWTTGRNAGIEQMTRSMRLLRSTKLDLLQVHNLVDAATHLDTLRGWKSEGRVRYLGITHYHSGAYDEIIRLLTKGGIDFLQVNYSLLERESERRVLPLARDRGVAVIINRPFAEGALFQRVKGVTFPAWAAEIDCNSWAQLFLKWIVSHPAVTCAIPATSKKKHLEDNIRAGFGRMLDEATRRKIAALLD